jgi:hypothetical protein
MVLISGVCCLIRRVSRGVMQCNGGQCSICLSEDEGQGDRPTNGIGHEERARLLSTRHPFTFSDITDHWLEVSLPADRRPEEDDRGHFQSSPNRPRLPARTQFVYLFLRQPETLWLETGKDSIKFHLCIAWLFRVLSATCPEAGAKKQPRAIYMKQISPHLRQPATAQPAH